MSQENVHRFIEIAEAFNRRDVGGLLALMDSEIEFEPQQSALQGTFVGHQGVGEWLADLAQHYEIESGHVDYADIRDLGDRVLGLGTLRFTGKGSGIETEAPLAVVATFRDGLMTQFKDYGDKDQALEAVGLSE
jgi:ketosteroid isomerase-like protein